MSQCIVCDSAEFINDIDFGYHILSNRYYRKNASDENCHIEIAQCSSCGLVQQLDILQSNKLTPNVNWLKYNEPESHLDELANTISSLPGVNYNSCIYGLTEKDYTVIDRLERKGFHKLIKINKNDLCIDIENAGIEVIQEEITEDSAAALLKKYPDPSVLIVRHIFEHAHYPVEFINGLKTLASNKDAYIVLEVPDYLKAFKGFDYSTVWEEHTMYFTLSSFKQTLMQSGFTIVYINEYEYTHENCLVAIVKVSDNCCKTYDDISIESKILKKYKIEYVKKTDRIRSLLSSYLSNNEKIAIYGTGHLSVMFINLMKIEEFIEIAIDDDPNRVGYHLPESNLIIQTSKALYEKEISICLLAVGSESEVKIINKNKTFIDKGGVFYSIFPFSNISIDLA